MSVYNHPSHLTKVHGINPIQFFAKQVFRKTLFTHHYDHTKLVMLISP